MPNQATSARPPLTRERILAAAMNLADREGLGALTMRRLGADLAFEAMSLYKHVANKEEILDRMVELVADEIKVPGAGEDWREAMRRRAFSAREVLNRHPWAIGLLEGRGSNVPAALRYRNAILGNLMSAGFSLEDAAHAFWLLDCYVYGHVIQETSMAPNSPEETTGSAASTLEETTVNEYPHLAAMYEHALTFGYSFNGEFEFGLELILDGLEQHRAT